DDRLGDSLDPDECAAAVAAAVVADRLDRVDLVGPSVLAEAEEDHAVAVCHGLIIAAAPEARVGAVRRLDVHARAWTRPPTQRVGKNDPPPSRSTLAVPGAGMGDWFAPFLRRSATHRLETR